ncbi:peptidoglycan DD-metalloendopeptidase family protein [Aquabacterium sp. A7-Y]|uniref:M23 family metallopeptidase n=1 Tax=Aquabacterium sp. A7-Y TaxID=1349605 RepID=UPI00223D0C1C|nr:M23 family metallopeptidase [Aquabacterium sp. A7-Y]MCW7537872.1 peptidoglycan DD-metalloendopeptidase family protein [Aquabacterium sp. A7-Y]
MHPHPRLRSARPAGLALLFALAWFHAAPAEATRCTPRNEERSDPNTGQRWSQSWYCGNDASAPMFAGPNPASRVATLQSRQSWFVCWRRGDAHAGGNDVWYYTQGDSAAAGWEARRGWGYVPAVALATSVDPDPGMPECQPDMWQARKQVSDPNTGRSWSTVWYGRNDAGATLYLAPDGATATGRLDSTLSYFVCHARGARHGGGNDVWYYTQGDRSAPGQEARRAWGYVPAQNLHTRSDPYDSIPACGDNPAPPPPPPPAGPYVLPLPLDAFERAIGSLTNNHWGGNYWAIDLLVPVGTPVYSVSAGVVSNYSQGTCGNGLTVRGDDGLSYLYCHGDSYVGVQPGQRVAAGQQILRSGNTGQSGAPHLHLEIKQWSGDWGSSPAWCAQRFLRAIHRGQPQSPRNFPASGGDCTAP